MPNINVPYKGSCLLDVTTWIDPPANSYRLAFRKDGLKINIKNKLNFNQAKIKTVLLFFIDNGHNEVDV